MKNIIFIDTSNNCNCDLVGNTNDGTNRVFLDIKSDILRNPVLNIDGTQVKLTGSPFVYEIPVNMLIGSGNLTFNLSDDSHTGNYFSIKKLSSIIGNLLLKQVDNFNYRLSDIVPNTTGVPIATEKRLGVVRGGDNVKIRENGSMFCETTGDFEPISNMRLEEILI